MDTSHRERDARRFVFWAVATTLGLFGVLRLPWVEASVLLPLTRSQGDVAAALFGTPVLPVQVTLACSGADALALCAGAVLAYPAQWYARVAGALSGMAMILVLNTLRIGTLGRVIDSPTTFDTLHLYVWPAVLTLAIAAYVFSWMQLAGQAPPACEAGAGARPAVAAPRAWRPSRRFVVLAVVFTSLFAAASASVLESPLVLTVGIMIANSAAALLTGAGITAQASDNVLATSRGAFIVTQECVSTPLIPLYLAAVCAYAPDRRQLCLGLLATPPLVIALGILRLLLVAVPATVVDSPTFLVHAFYQLLLGAVVVLLAANWRHGRRAAPAYAAAGAAAGVLFVFLIGAAYSSYISTSSSQALDDPQGALAFLPAFQVGLYLALCVAAANAGRWPRLAVGLGLLVLTQMAGLLLLNALTLAGVVAQVRDVRAWAIAGPVLIFAVMVHGVRTPR